MYYVENGTTFQGKTPSSGSKMGQLEASMKHVAFIREDGGDNSSETLVDFQPTAWHHVPRILHSYRCENLKF
jgi:hypothetical protein